MNYRKNKQHFIDKSYTIIIHWKWHIKGVDYLEIIESHVVNIEMPYKWTTKYRNRSFQIINE